MFDQNQGKIQEVWRAFQKTTIELVRAANIAKSSHNSRSCFDTDLRNLERGSLSLRDIVLGEIYVRQC